MSHPCMMSHPRGGTTAATTVAKVLERDREALAENHCLTVVALIAVPALESEPNRDNSVTRCDAMAAFIFLRLKRIYT